jgi:hypothetical protein
LYYNSIEHDYLDQNVVFLNHDNLIEKLRILINGADTFLGVNIKRYIVNISCLPIKSVQSRSHESLVFEPLNDEHANNYINKLIMTKRDENQYTLNAYATGWYLDGKYTPQFPEGAIGKKISFDYIGIVSERSIVDQFVDLLKEVGCKPLDITCNSLCLGIYVNGGNTDGVVIDIKNTSTVVNLYNKHGEIKAVTKINKGSNWYLQEIKRLLEIDPQTNLAPMIESLDLIGNVDKDTVLLHKHTSEFLTIKEANVQSIATALKITSKNLFHEIDAVLIEMKTKCHTDFAKVYLNVAESLVYAFRDVCPLRTIDNLAIQVLTNTVIGLEDYAVNNMLAATTYVYNLQTQTNEFHTYSIDPFISEQTSDYQFKQNL